MNAKKHISVAARELRIKAKMYKGVAIVMGVFGLFFLFALYSGLAQGDPAVFFKQPVLLLVLLLPFIPSLFFLWLTEKTAKAFYKLVYSDGAETGVESSKAKPAQKAKAKK